MGESPSREQVAPQRARAGWDRPIRRLFRRRGGQAGGSRHLPRRIL